MSSSTIMPLGRPESGRAERRPFRWPQLLTGSGRGIGFGGDYNPDQWPEATVDEDIRLMARAGVNTVALGIFSWASIEPEEGRYEFGWLDRIIDKLGRAGIAVDLASATAAAPLWLYERYPQVLPVDRYGHVVNAGSRQSWRPTSPVFREHALALCRAMATRYGDHPAVTAWHVGNEYGWNNRYDYSDDALAAFRVWCEARYGDVATLNEAWGTAFWSQHVNSFDEVLLPRHMGTDAMVNPAQRLDFERFGNDMLLDFYRAERDAIAAICPDKPCTTNFMVSTDQCVMDYAQWADAVDFVANDHYFHEGESHLDELACSDALMDALADGNPWCVMEHSTSAVQWKPFNARKRHGELVRDALAHVAMGADSINFFQWRQSACGAEQFHSAMLPHAGEDTKVFRQVCELGGMLRTLSGAGLDGTVLRRADTAILFDAQAEWATRSETLPSGRINHWHDVRDWYRGCLDAGRRADVMPLAYDWSGYRTVILPTVLTLDEADVRRLVDFAAGGGTVVVGYATGLIDGNCRVGLGGYPGAGGGLLRDMLAVRSEEFNILDPDGAAGVAGAGGEPTEVALSNGMVSRLWQNDAAVTAPDVTVVAAYAGVGAVDWQLDGVPAITRRPYGQGEAIYVGCDLDRHDIAALVLRMAADADTDPRILHTVRESADGASRFDFYFNRTPLPATISGIAGEPVIAYRCEPGLADFAAGAGGYELDRNGVLVTMASR